MVDLHPKMRTLLATLLLGVSCLAAPALAAPPTTTDVPVVVEAMKKKYGLPTTPTPGAKSVDGLAGLVELQRSAWPGAVVTSGFYDWRTVSQYRSRAGLHLGYDIAMPAGSPVRAGWSGSVVSVAPWTDTQWGITVLSGSGLEVTYGHLSPSVSVGDAIQVGDVVGTVVVDHVDVKMRDTAGNYVDFGKDGSAPPTPFDTVRMTSRESQMVAWLVARNNLEVAEDELVTRRREKAVASIERKRLEQRVKELEATVPLMAKYVEDGLVARVEAEQTRADLAEAKKQLAKVKRTQKQGPQGLTALERQVQAARNRLAAAERVARERGITWKEVTGFVNGIVADNPKLRDQVLDYKRTTGTKAARKVEDLRRDVREGREDLKELETLYQMGGLPRREIEAARLRQKALEAELKALGG